MFEDSDLTTSHGRNGIEELQQYLEYHKTISHDSRRGRMEIIAEILVFCKKERVKTSIMNKTNINYTRLKKYLNFLTARGMLSNNMGKYSITHKGRCFLELFVRLHGILQTEEV